MINQPQGQQWLFIKTIKLFLAEMFIKTMPNGIFLSVLFGLRIIMLLCILLWANDYNDVSSGDHSTVAISQQVILFVQWLCLVFTALIITGISYLLYKLYNRIKRQNKRKQQQSYFFNIIQKTVLYCLVVYRIFLILPMVFFSFAAIQKQSLLQLQQTGRKGQVEGLVVCNLIFGLGLVYTISGLGFWNKIGIRQNGLAYCTIMNIQSLIYVFLPIIIILRVHTWLIHPYVSILFSILTIITIYIYPLVTFNHNKLHTIASSGVVSLICVLGFGVLVQAWINTFGRFFVVFLVISVMTVVMWQLQQYRMRALLCVRDGIDENINGNNVSNNFYNINNNVNNINDTHNNKDNQKQPVTIINKANNNNNNNNNNNEQNTYDNSNNNDQNNNSNKLSWIDSQSYYQNLLFHLINWSNCQNDLLLHVVSTLRYKGGSGSGNRSDINGINEDGELVVGNQSKVLKDGHNSHRNNINNNPFEYILKTHHHHPTSSTSPLTQILTTLSSQYIPQPHLYQLFCQLISQKLTTKCNLQSIKNQKLGHRQLLKVLQQSMGYFILLLQSLMMNNNNFPKTYLLIKLQQQLLKQAQTKSFIQSTYALTIVTIIESYFVQQFKTHTNQYSPGHNYFLFQQKYEKLKNYITLSAQNKLLFWKQTNKQQPLQKKLKQCITKNYLFQMKILKHTHKLTNTYHTSPLILLTLIQSYTELALNTNMTSSKNIFNFLAVQFHKLYNQNKNNYFGSKMKENQSNFGLGTLGNFANFSTVKDTIAKNTYKLENNLYVELDNNPSSHMEKQANPNEKYQQTNKNKYAIEKSIGVFLINLQSQQYKIQWANQYFWQNYTHRRKSQESSSDQDKDKQNEKDFKLNDFIVPQLRSVHDKYIHNFIDKGASFAYKHAQTQLYFADDQTFFNVQMEFQFLPSLAEGLKMMGFILPIKEIKKDVVQIMIKNDLTFVACTKSFMDHYDEYSLVKNHLNFEKDKALAFEIIMQNNIFSEFFNNIRLKQSGYGRKKQQKSEQKQRQQDLQSRITHLGVDYVVKLKKKIEYEGKGRDGMKQTQLQMKKHLLVFELQMEESMTISKAEVITIEQKQFVSTPMKKSPTNKGSLEAMSQSFLHQQDKIDQSPRSLKGSQSTFFKGSQSTFMKGSQTLKTGRTSPKNQSDNIMEDILIKEREKIEDKPLQIINLQKCYEILVSQRTPNNVKKWRMFTVFVLILLMGAMICNMASLTLRQDLYEQNNELAINYSSLIADLSATVTAIREYNFYVTTYSTDRPEISFIVKKLVQLTDLIQKKVKLLASVLKKVWSAYEILPTGATIDVQDTSYVVISNYLLSSVTFASQLPASNMSFPILVGEMYASETPPTPAQISFLEAVFNGLYVAIPNLLVDRKQFINTMNDNLLSTSGMYFIYTCIGGAVCLFLFFTLSLILQLKSQGIRSQTGGLLSSQLITVQQKSKKIQRLQKLGEILQKSKGETVVMPNWQDQQQKYKYLDILACTLKDFDHKDQQTHHQQLQGQSEVQLNGIVSKQHIIDDKTNRQFMDNEESMKSSHVSSSENGERLSQQHTQKGMKRGDMQSIQTLQKLKYLKPRKNNYNVNKNEKGGNFQIYTVTFKQRSLLIIFYLIVCIPFLCYFIGILIGSMSMNSTITNHITITSQVYNRKSYQEIVYLLTRQTAYFEDFLVQKIGDWNKYLMAMIDETYDRDRKTEKLVMEQKTAINLQNKLAQLNHNNLCKQISSFSPSTYYNITLSEQECNILGYNIMNHGYKQLVVSLLQTSLQLNKNYPSPQNLTDPQRLNYLQNDQLKKMKGLLAYSQLFVEKMIDTSLIDTQAQIQQLRKMSILLSLISIFSLILFLLVVRYRYKKLLLQRRQVQSIISLISIQTISNSLNLNQKQKSQNNQLIKMVQKIDWMFYQ